MTVRELIAILGTVPDKEVRVLFDTEAARFHCHMVDIDNCFYEDLPEPHVGLHSRAEREYGNDRALLAEGRVAELTERAEAAERGMAALRKAAEKALSCIATMALRGHDGRPKNEIARLEDSLRDALASDAGRGWLSPENAAKVREAMRLLYRAYCDESTMEDADIDKVPALLALLGDRE